MITGVREFISQARNIELAELQAQTEEEVCMAPATCSAGYCMYTSFTDRERLRLLNFEGSSLRQGNKPRAAAMRLMS